MLSKTEYNRYLLKMQIVNVLANMEEDTKLFETRRCSYPNRFRAVNNGNARHTD